VATYIALIRKEPDSDFGVEFPDSPGCISAGTDLEDARHMAAEALALHIAGMLEDRAPIPEPSALDAIMVDPENRDAVAFLVDVATRPVKAVRINVSLPDDLIGAIDRVSPNRSRFLADAARAMLRGLDDTGPVVENARVGDGDIIKPRRRGDMGGSRSLR
jgi:predicted RNase H-like HicB family nuclease